MDFGGLGTTRSSIIPPAPIALAGPPASINPVLLSRMLTNTTRSSMGTSSSIISPAPVTVSRPLTTIDPVLLSRPSTNTTRSSCHPGSTPGTASTCRSKSMSSEQERRTIAYWTKPERAHWWEIIKKAQTKTPALLVDTFFHLPNLLTIHNILRDEYDAYLLDHPTGPESGWWIV
jgi:hypothetical protein